MSWNILMAKASTRTDPGKWTPDLGPSVAGRRDDCLCFRRSDESSGCYPSVSTAKPANILLASNGQVKLADLGLAKMLAAHKGSSAQTAAGVALGTPNYMSPEQFEDASHVDHRADIFSLGATLHHMLSGRAPFNGESFFSILKQVNEADPDPLPSHVPAQVEQLVLRMMEKLPESRFQTYGELLNALQQARRFVEETRENVAETTELPTGPSVIPAVKIAGHALRPAAPRENRVLLVVDIQNDFCPQGALAVPEGDQVVPIINRLSRRFAHVILTQDWHCEDHLSFASSHPGKQPLERIELSYGSQILWPDHCVQGTHGVQFHPDLDVANCELIIRKGYHREIDSYSRVFRKRPANADRTGRISPRTRIDPHLPRRSGYRLLRGIYGT